MYGENWKTGDWSTMLSVCVVWGADMVAAARSGGREAVEVENTMCARGEMGGSRRERPDSDLSGAAVD